MDVDVVARVSAQVKEIKDKVLALRDASASNIQIFSGAHEAAYRIQVKIDLTAYTNCTVHVSIVSRDLANIQLCVIDQWQDEQLTPTLIAHFYLATFEFLLKWPGVLFEKPTKSCLRRLRSDAFSPEVQALNTKFMEVRRDWWDRLYAVRTNYAAHYDRDSANLVRSLQEVTFLSFLDLAHDVNGLLRDTAKTLRLINDEMAVVLRANLGESSS